MNTETKHTPGPWTLMRTPFSDSDNGINLKGNNGNTMIANFPCLGKVEWVAYTPGEEDAANLLLMAAAPELLKALEDLSEIVDWLIQSGNVNSPIEPHPYGCGVILARQQARSAIARARGE